jgi:glycerol-3-phosphate dehydrogenase (NAD(P)+)
MVISASKKISILGSGSWGNTLACHFSKDFEILLWDYKPERVEIMSKSRLFDKPKEGIYPENINFTADLRAALEFSDFIFSVIPLKGINDLSENILKISNLTALNFDPNLNFSKNTEYFRNFSKKVIINCSKGIDLVSLKTPSEIFTEKLKNFHIATLSGPNLAIEVLAGEPMISSIASSELTVAEGLQEVFSCTRFRLYPSNDIVGVEFCSAIKNVIAIAAGASDGLGFRASTKASLITRALNEMRELIKLKGGLEETLYSAAGLGDLIATCSSELSRNYRVGYFLAQNYSLDEIYKKINATAEGINTAFALKKLAQTENLRIPICLEVADMLSGSKNPAEVVNSLMSRKIK